MSFSSIAMERELLKPPLGALPAGTRVRKVEHPVLRDGRILPGSDMIPIGAQGTITGAMGHPIDHSVGYFLQWDAFPHIESFAIDHMIVPLEVH